jgi:hypothetical protein
MLKKSKNSSVEKGNSTQVFFPQKTIGGSTKFPVRVVHPIVSGLLSYFRPPAPLMPL